MSRGPNQPPAHGESLERVPDVVVFDLTGIQLSGTLFYYSDQELIT